MTELDHRIEDELQRVWAAALDAKAMMAEPDATEEHYLRKQRYHIDRAKAAILQIGGVAPAAEPSRFRAGTCPVCGHPEAAHTLTAYWECTACGGRCWAPEPPDEWYRDPDTGEMYQAWERALWELDALPPAARRGLIMHVRAEIARWTEQQS